MTTTTDLPIRCRCGALRGWVRDVSPATCTHAVCLCDDCQAYMKFLGAVNLLDVNGGTELTQVAQNHVELTLGRENLGCVRLSHRGMFRWYAKCCNTPIANTLGAQSLFAGVVHACLGTPADGRPLTAAIGPIRGRVQAKFGKGPLPADAHRFASLGVIWWSARRFAAWWWAGASKPSTFFRDGGPCVAPQVLSAEERKALY